MPTFTSRDGKYALAQNGTRIDVVNTPNNPAQVAQTTVRAEGATQSVKSYREVFGVEPSPLLICYPVHGKQQWDVDCAAGLMRWVGQKTSREIYGAMNRLGFVSALDRLPCRSRRPRPCLRVIVLSVRLPTAVSVQ